MSKIISIFLAAIITFSFAACAKTKETPSDVPTEEQTTDDNSESEETDPEQTDAPSEGEFKKLINEGYYISEVRANIDDIRITLNKFDSDTVIGVGREWNKQLFDEYYDLRAYDDFDDRLVDYLDKIGDILIKDITDLIPGEEQLSVYVGKTMADIEADGYTYEDASHFETECYLFFTNGLYVIQATSDSFEGDSSEFTHEQDMALTVSEVEYVEYDIDLLK